jgi:predicted  nucleic acid-binding Zn-ribbon protein
MLYQLEVEFGSESGDDTLAVNLHHNVCLAGGNMVDRVEALYRLQLIDTETGEKKEILRRVESQLDRKEGLLSAQRKLSDGEVSLRKSQGKLRSLELDLEEILSKIASTQQMLYGGEITNPKELASLEQEIDYLKRRQSEVEDETLETMAEVEDRESWLKAEEERLERMEEDWEAIQEDLRRRAVELGSRLKYLEGKREEILLMISEEDLPMYDDLRRQKGGQAVAVLEGGICQGCRVALPTSLVQKVRRGQDLVYCGSCQRILYSLS